MSNFTEQAPACTPTFESLPVAVANLDKKVDTLMVMVQALLDLPQNAVERDKLLDVNEVAELLGKSVRTIHTMTSEKRIPFTKMGNKLYFVKGEILDWIRDGKTTVETEKAKFDAHLEEMARGGRNRKSRVSV